MTHPSAVLVAVSGTSQLGKGLWYASRSTGLVLLVLLTLTVVLGAISSSRRTPRWWPRFITTEVHRNIALMSFALLCVHVTTVVLDSFVTIRWIDAVVPFISPYRRTWLGLGSTACDIMLAVLLTTAVRRRMQPRQWRGVHLLSYAAWPMAVLHGLGTGTDTKMFLVYVLTFGCVAAVVAALMTRLFLAGDASRRVVAGAWVLAVALPLALGTWLQTGPMAPGWSQKAGTPPPASSK